MVFDSANLNQVTVLTSDCAADVLVELICDFGVNRIPTELGTKDDVIRELRI